MSRTLVRVISGEPWRLGHRRGLDGLRGIAVGLVLLGHAEIRWFVWSAQVGVVLFFVLSGFLITALLLDEHRSTDRIDFRAFYGRRVRRLAPAFLLCVAVTCVLGVAARGTGFVTVRDVLLSLSYVGNWYPALMAHAGYTPLGALSGTWSLAVEEQFYLVWPLVVLLVVRRWGVRGLIRVALVGAAGSVALRFLLIAGGATSSRIYFGTDTNAVGLLVGAALAGGLYQRSSRRELPLWPLAVASVGLLGVGSLMAWQVVVLVAVACGAVAIAVLATSTRRTWLEWSWLRWLGRRSYAVYLWNCLITAALFYVDVPWPVLLVAITVPSLLIAELSWRCVESPFLRVSTQVMRNQSKYASTPPPAFASLQAKPMTPGVKPGL